MKILLITTVFPSPLQPNKGAFNRAMVQALSVEHEVKVVSPIPWTIAFPRPQGMPRACAIGGVEAHYPVYFYTPKIFRRWYGEFFWHSVRSTLRMVVRDFPPDVVMGYWAHPDGHAAVRLARRLHIPSVVMVGGTDVLVLADDAGRRRSIRRVLEQADSVVTVSQDLKRVVAAWPVPAGKIHVVYRGIDTTRFHGGDRVAARMRLGLPSNAPVLIWVGHMVPVKGLDVLIDAMALAMARADFRLYLVGDGPLRAELERRSAALRLANRVTFAGYVAHDELGDWYRAADLTVLPSRSEGVPNVLLESIASGTPFVASRVGGVPEIADPLIDRLVSPGDPTALADAVVDAITSPSRLPRRYVPVSSSQASAQLLQVLAGVAGTRMPPVAVSGTWAATPTVGVRTARI